MYKLKRPPQVIPVLLAGVALLLSLLLLCWKAGAIDQPGARSPVAPSAESSQGVVDDTVSANSLELAPSTTNVPSPVLAPASAEESVPTNSVVVPDPAGVLNRARLFALGMIETGNNDSAIGGLGEVSRFQIMPSVWRQYSTSRSYENPDVSTEVASQHWSSLHVYFRKKTGREPTDFDMYVLWNTRFGYYAAREFSPNRLHPAVSDRAQRFANLVEDGYRRASVLVAATRH